MASRPTQRNTRRTYARPGTELSGPVIAIASRHAPRGPGAAAARLLPAVAAAVAVAVSPRAVRAISPPVIHAVSPRAVRAISPRGQNAPRTARAHVRAASSSAPSSQQASWRRGEARAPPCGRAPCRHSSIPQQSPSCVSVSGFAAVGVRNPTGDRANFQSEFACASSVAFSLGTQRSPRRGRVRFVWFLICTRP